MSAQPDRLASDFANLLRGFLMGGADIIPGVSGGTVALILGIYERLVGAISQVDKNLVGLLKERKWKQAVDHLDLRFLITLGLGIGIGVVSLAGAMHTLLVHHRMLTLAAFFGLIAASSWLVARLIARWRPIEFIALIAGAVFAFWLVGLPLLQDPPDNYFYLFFCGALAICAMILPGISGAFILLMLGKYVEITGMIKGLLHGEISLDILATIAVFALGCLTGLLTFSKLLKWLLAHQFNITMALLCGFMLGSLRKLFPFQQDLTPDVEELKHKLFRNRSLSEVDFTSELLPALAVALLAAGALLLLTKIAQPKSERNG